MLFKFASYLLGTNNEEENKQDLQIEDQKQENTFDDLKKNEDINEENNLNNETNENLQENNYMYSEYIIKSPFLNKNGSENVNSDNDEEEEEEGDEENWIYISPIKRKSFEDQNDSLEKSDLWDEESEEEEFKSKQLISKDESLNKIEKARFNFYDYFNNKNSCNEENELKACSKKSSMKSFSFNGKDQNKEYSNRMEESWVIHPPACFQLDNTFTIEEHPLENLYIENPALSVIASCKSLEKENSLILVNSAKKFNSKLILTSFDKKVIKKDVKSSSRKSMQKSSNSTRKTSKKQNKKNKKQIKKNESEISKNINDSNENNSENNEQQKQQVLQERQEKKLLAHYLTINPKSLYLANSFIPSPNVSANNSTNHSHQHNHNFISNNCNSTNNNNTEHQNGSKGLKRNNKVALKRENMSKNKPFTLHRKLC